MAIPKSIQRAWIKPKVEEVKVIEPPAPVKQPEPEIVKKE